jgi:hypothetical protein
MTGLDFKDECGAASPVSPRLSLKEEEQSRGIMKAAWLRQATFGESAARGFRDEHIGHLIALHIFDIGSNQDLILQPSTNASPIRRL